MENIFDSNLTCASTPSPHLLQDVTLESISHSFRKLKELQKDYDPPPDVFVFRRQEYELLKLHCKNENQFTTSDHLGLNNNFLMGIPFHVAETEHEWCEICVKLAFLEHKKVGIIKSEEQENE